MYAVTTTSTVQYEMVVVPFISTLEYRILQYKSWSFSIIDYVKNIHRKRLYRFHYPDDRNVNSILFLMIWFILIIKVCIHVLKILLACKKNNISTHTTHIVESDWDLPHHNKNLCLLYFFCIISWLYKTGYRITII